MNNKITFPGLAAMLADKSGRSKRFSEDFLREFFALISESLENGESVKIKGLGTFRLSRVEPRKSVDVTTGQPMEIAGHSKVVFVPAKELAEAVNAPFEAFSAVEIPDSADLSALESDDAESSPVANDLIPLVIEEEEVVASDSETIKMDSFAPVMEPDEDKIDSSDAEVEESEEEFVEEETDEGSDKDSGTGAEEEIEVPVYEDGTSSSRRKWFSGFFVGIAAAVFVIAVAAGLWIWFAKPDFSTLLASGKSHVVEKVIVANAEVNDSAVVIPIENIEPKEVVADVDDVPTAPSDRPVYDTIGKTRYLTTMAKDHYGNFNLWPYIYEENKSFLRHPDRIRPGTQVVVPNLSKYGVDPNNKKDIEKAKALGVEIYSRYKLN